MKNQNANVFLKTKETLRDGKRMYTCPLGQLEKNELLEYKRIIENTDFTNGGYCMRLVNPILKEKTNGDLKLDLQLYPDIHSNKCQYAGYPSDCPFAIVHGKCKHPLVTKFIGRKFYPGLYSDEYLNYLKGIER